MKQLYTNIFDVQPIIVPKLEIKLAKYGVAVCGTTFFFSLKENHILPSIQQIWGPHFWNSSWGNMESTKGGINPTNNSWQWDTITLTQPNSLKVTTPPSALQPHTHISYKPSRHECSKAFHTWGLDLIRLIHPPLNGCIQVFATLSNSLIWWKQFHSIKAMAMVVAKLIKKHLIFDVSLISDNNRSPICQFLEASPMKLQEADELSQYPSMVRPLHAKVQCLQ